MQRSTWRGLAEALPALLVPHDLPDHPEATPLVENGARLTFERVSFRYPDGQRVFSKFNLEVEPGQRVGLLGRSGSGKSTLFALIQRFYDVQGGRILIDGQDIAKVTQDSLRNAIAVVPQNVSLFQRSVMENIRYGRPDATDDMVMAAAVAARCDFIEQSAGRIRHHRRQPSASSSPAASASASRSRVHSSRTRRSCCLMKRPRPSTSNPRRRFVRRSGG